MGQLTNILWVDQAVWTGLCLARRGMLTRCGMIPCAFVTRHAEVEELRQEARSGNTQLRGYLNWICSSFGDDGIAQITTPNQVATIAQEELLGYVRPKAHLTPLYGWSSTQFRRGLYTHYKDSRQGWDDHLQYKELIAHLSIHLCNQTPVL